ncbi:PREDICTED: pre-mRNA-splicing factor CWC22 homolog [Acropora digitifera]|uniref:pre-mRNA-splicing factor CWC22 homolog n=1 Tax=Acropora digitifera TaxID=70779 RepID=UPI00077ADAAC|nr:PREDICTED: pre-mRNA-splicing factor CWC22 homolog [Acropora digitifera]
MAAVEGSRIRSIVQTVQHSNSPNAGPAKSRSRSRSPQDRQKQRKEDKENRRRDYGDDYRRHHRRKRRSNSYDDDRSRRKDRHIRHERDRKHRNSDEHDEREGVRRRRERDYKSDRRRRDTPSDDEREQERRMRSHVEERNQNYYASESEVKVTEKNDEKSEESSVPVKKKVDPNNPLLTKTGGAYIPPARLKMMQESIEDKSSEAYQRLSWEALKKSINGLVNKVNTSNIGNIVRELFQENIVRGRGVLCQSIIRAQAASPTFTHVYAALVAILNTKFPKNGELLLRRLILQFRRAYRRNDKVKEPYSILFFYRHINRNRAHELLALEILTLLLHKPTDDSVEVAIGFLKEVGLKLTEVSSRGVHAVFERLRNILHSAEIDKRVQYMIEVMFAIRKDGFKDHPAVLPELDLVEEEDQITHLLRLEEQAKAEEILSMFLYERFFFFISFSLFPLDDQKMEIIDHTETNLIALRRTIYLTIQSSLDFEECAHKLLKMQLKDEQLPEFCTMVIDCCAQQRSYEKFFGLLAQRFCQLNKIYMEEYIRAFNEQYETIHRLETNKLRNVAKFFAHLLYTDAIPWTVLDCIKLNEDDTTSSRFVIFSKHPTVHE